MLLVIQNRKMKDLSLTGSWSFYNLFQQDDYLSICKSICFFAANILIHQKHLNSKRILLIIRHLLCISEKNFLLLKHDFGKFALTNNRIWGRYFFRFFRSQINNYFIHQPSKTQLSCYKIYFKANFRVIKFSLVSTQKTKQLPTRFHSWARRQPLVQF